MQTRILKGHWVSESGQLQQGTLIVEVSGLGIAYDADLGGGEELTARVESQGGGVVADAITNGCWSFLADAGECERAGIVVLGAND